MREKLQGRGLYVITDGPRPDLVPVVAQALAGGARLLQYRDKTRDHERRLTEARAIRALCAARQNDLKRAERDLATAKMLDPVRIVR